MKCNCFSSKDAALTLWLHMYSVFLQKQDISGVDADIPLYFTLLGSGFICYDSINCEVNLFKFHFL